MICYQFSKFYAKERYEITIKISFIQCYAVISYCFISILLVFSIPCLVLRIAHHLIIICLDKRISILLVSHNGHCFVMQCFEIVLFVES